MDDILYKQGAVSAVVWPWARSLKAPTGRPSLRPVIMRGAIMAAVASVFSYVFSQHHMGALVACMGIVVVVIGTISPKALHAVDHAFQVFGTWVGVALSWILLVPVFVLCFVPAHVILKLKGKDPMLRQFEKDKPSYWTPVTRVKPEGSYRKQW